MKKEKSILLVDSDQAFREGVVNLLLVSGFGKVQVAGSIKGALQKVSRYYFDVIIIDLFMPQMSGLNLAQQVQKQQADAEIILSVDDQYQSFVNSRNLDTESPTLLKSHVNCILPQLLSEN